jgi:hypothetical protein
MRIHDCNLNANGVVMRPLVIREPEPEWVERKGKGTVPENLYQFYRSAGHFSIDQAPPFLDDPKRILFSFLKGLVTGLADNLEEAHELIAAIQVEQAKVYSPTKKAKGQISDPRAATRQSRCFCYLLVELSGALDKFAEIVSMFFQGEIKRLVHGRSSFTDLWKVAQETRTPKANILSPKQVYFERIRSFLVKELLSSGEEEGWFDLFCLYRNKQTHLGKMMFPIISLHDKNGQFYQFTPNHWPHFHQSHMQNANTELSKEPNSLQRFLEEQYIHQDIVEYSHDLVHRVQGLLDRGFQILREVYIQLKDSPLNNAALDSLKKCEQSYKFRGFSAKSGAPSC